MSENAENRHRAELKPCAFAANVLLVARQSEAKVAPGARDIAADLTTDSWSGEKHAIALMSNNEMARPCFQCGGAGMIAPEP
jgi:hypothetical protein